MLDSDDRLPSWLRPSTRGSSLINDPFHAKFHESPPSRWPRQRGLGGDAFPRPRSGGASCFQSRLVLSAATTSRSPLLGSGGRSTRREVGGQVSRVHLEELHRLRQPAEAPGAKAPEADPVWERLDDRRAHGRRHDDLHRDGRFRIIRRERAPSTTRVRWPRLVHSERVARIDRHASFQAKGAAGGAAAECDSWRPAVGWSVDRRDRVA